MVLDSSPSAAIFTSFLLNALSVNFFVTSSFVQHSNHLCPCLPHFWQSSASFLSFSTSSGIPFNSTVLSFHSIFFPLSFLNSFFPYSLYFCSLPLFGFRSILVSYFWVLSPYWFIRL